MAIRCASASRALFVKTLLVDHGSVLFCSKHTRYAIILGPRMGETRRIMESKSRSRSMDTDTSILFSHVVQEAAVLEPH